MQEATGILTTKGTPVLSYDKIKKLRADNANVTNGNTFVAQAGPQEKALASDVDILITGGNRGGGKGNTYVTPVATPDGFKLMGNLKVGDKVLTPWEGVQTVTEIFELGSKITYNFYFDDSSKVSVTDDHRFLARGPKEKNYTLMSARDIMNHYRIDGLGLFALRTGEKGFFEMPLPAPIDFHNGITMDDLPIHPKILGMMMSAGWVRFSRFGGLLPSFTPDTYKLVYSLGYKLNIRGSRKNAKAYVTGIPDDAGLEWTLRRVAIPATLTDKYLYADIESRIAFMQGIFYLNRKHYQGHLYLRLPNKVFMHQIAQICRSLGWWTSLTSDTDPLDGMEYWTCVVIAPDDNVPGLNAPLQNKEKYKVNAAVPQSKTDGNGLCRKIVRVRKSETRSLCRCITISGNDHLYLTDGYAINHNTFTLLMDNLYNIDNSRFNAIIFRKEKDDLKNIIRDSQTLYKGEGVYNRSKDDMTWYFNSGAMLSLTYYEGKYQDFLERFQGRQYSYIGIDEITQMDYPKFKYLITTNRNAAGIRNRIIGTCNPDPLSWVRSFIDWWIDADGFPVKERDGRIRYCYMKGDDVTQIVWGDSREEVYEQCKDEIDRLWETTWGNSLPPVGYTPEKMFTKSVTFIRAELKYNRILTDNDPSYFANLAQQSDEQKARDLMGNWDFMSMGDDLIKMADMQACFDNSQQLGNSVRYVSCDVAFTGGDQCVMWLWAGWHVQDIYVCKLNSKDTVEVVKAKLVEWGVPENHFTYDLNGLGQTFKGFFKHALPFNNLEAVKPKYKNIYDNVKSQCAYEFAQKILEREISFNPSILTRRFSGKGYKNRPLQDILQIERKCIRQDTDKRDKGWCLIKKAQMKTLVGHSPDFFEALMMRMIFEIKTSVMEIPQWARNF